MPPVHTQPPSSDVYVLHGVFPLLTVSHVAAMTGKTTTLGQGYWDWQIAADGQGNVYVQDTIAVYRIDTGGSTTKVHDSADGHGPWRLAADWAGNLYVAGDFPSGWVRKIPADGTPPAVVWSGGPVPWDIAVDAHQNLYITTSPPLTVTRISPGGAQTAVVGPIPNTADYWPGTSVAVDPQGSNVYLGGGRYRPDQTIETFIIKTPTNASPSTTLDVTPSNPGNLCADDHGYVYFTDSYGDRVVMADTNSGRQVAIFHGGDPNSIAVRPVRAHRFTVPELIGKLFGAAAADGGGWLLIGDHFVPIPPRSPELAALLHAASAHRARAVHNPELADRVRSAGTQEAQ